MQLQSWKNFLVSLITKSIIVQEGRGEKRGGMREGMKGRGGRTEARLPSRNPDYAHEMRSTYNKMTYAYCT